MIPSPFLYQPWKHHLLFLQERIRVALEKGEKAAGVPEGLNKMGDSVSDLYIGAWPVEAVRSRIASSLPSQALSDPFAFREWVGPDGYRTLELPDASVWVLKPARKEERWIHFHPARVSPLTVRVRGRTLKTAFLVCLDSAHYGWDAMDKRSVDRIRAAHWGSGPMATLSPKKGLGRIIELLCKEGEE